MGKTTVPAQALAENRLAPQGEDIWIGVDAQDAEGDALAQVAAAAVVSCAAQLGDGEVPKAPTPRSRPRPWPAVTVRPPIATWSDAIPGVWPRQ